MPNDRKPTPEERADRIVASFILLTAAGKAKQLCRDAIAAIIREAVADADARRDADVAAAELRGAEGMRERCAAYIAETAANMDDEERSEPDLDAWCRWLAERIRALPARQEDGDAE